MKIEQKKLSNKHVFTFNDQNLNFAYEDRSGSADFDIAYGDIPKKTSVRIEENTWLRNVGILWGAFGIVGPLMKIGGAIWLPIGLICLVWYRLTRIKYTVMSADRGSVWVIQGKGHDAVMQEIADRRRKQLMAWYGDIDPENEPSNEIRKFMWLVEQEVITKEEAERKIAQIQNMAAITSPEAGRLLN